MNQCWLRRGPTVVARAGLARAWSAVKLEDRTIYAGEFVAFNRMGILRLILPGRVVEWEYFPTDVYICRPPEALRRLPKGPCLQLISPQDGWFKLHWERPARTFDESRAYVEELIGKLV